MFTGIVEALGAVKAIRLAGKAGKLVIDLGELVEGTKIGDSVAIDGACLTVTGLSGTVATFDVMAETLRRTALGQLSAGAPVNLERALRADSRLGGHFVLGHVDAVGTIADRIEAADECILWVEIPEDVAATMIEKGSVAIDGISLTVVEVKRSSFSVALIPHTLANTTLASKARGQQVNIETDMIGKYVIKLLGRMREGGGVTEELLREAGFGV